jgi:hypothetical protein
LNFEPIVNHGKKGLLQLISEILRKSEKIRFLKNPDKNPGILPGLLAAPNLL